MFNICVRSSVFIFNLDIAWSFINWIIFGSTIFCALGIPPFKKYSSKPISLIIPSRLSWFIIFLTAAEFIPNPDAISLWVPLPLIFMYCAITGSACKTLFISISPRELGPNLSSLPVASDINSL